MGKNGKRIADEDLAAMVVDRRSGRGKQTASGAPAHLPVPDIAADHISEDERQLLKSLVDEEASARREAEAAAATAAMRLAAVDAAMRHLLKKYGLAGKDSVNASTGAIARETTKR